MRVGGVLSDLDGLVQGWRPAAAILEHPSRHVRAKLEPLAHALEAELSTRWQCCLAELLKDLSSATRRLADLDTDTFVEAYLAQWRRDDQPYRDPTVNHEQLVVRGNAARCLLKLKDYGLPDRFGA